MQAKKKAAAKKVAPKKESAQKTLAKMGVLELKGMAYDLIAMLESVQGNLNAVNAELAKRQKKG